MQNLIKSVLSRGTSDVWVEMKHAFIMTEGNMCTSSGVDSISPAESGYLSGLILTLCKGRCPLNIEAFSLIIPVTTLFISWYPSSIILFTCFKVL
jgi:hypothetical protein